MLQSTTPYRRILHEISLTLRGVSWCDCPTSPNTVPATKTDSHEVSWLIQFTDEISIIQWRSNRCYLTTSLNTVPATKNDSYDWSLSRMKNHFQCAKQQALPSTITKYCGCHEKSFHIPLRIATLKWGWLTSKDDFLRHHIFLWGGTFGSVRSRWVIL